jgi:ubiquinone/menaquinone biosynthesis C-methylase UbiE
MTTTANPAAYEAWYHTPRGHWIGDAEFALLMRLLRPHPGASLLDVGCGTGYFSRRLAGQELKVTALDADAGMLDYARAKDVTVRYLRGDALALPFEDCSFDHCTAITSLCFVTDPVRALREMLRVARQNVVLGLLNRNSSLYRQKHDRSGYQGARWDSAENIRQWIAEINPALQAEIRTAVFFPGGGPFARLAEAWFPNLFPWGGLLAAVLRTEQS